MSSTIPISDLWSVLRTVLDPEVPVLSVVDLGIVRDVRVEADGEVVVTVTPTYSGCPAVQVIERDILAAVHAAGVERARVRTVFSPPWTTDWISDDARERLRAYGIAPPGRVEQGTDELVPLRRRVETPQCPFCGSHDTELRSEFGSTACKSIAYCNGCHQPFELFKAI
ncbi:MAG TPA: 1,2-phenylacetyl-CoA epoxidase subunit PaaD [Gemmatimonadaceae bacterium]|jgi:ring-1,2-phenylacetyl-CoA epoxidase subunit PaaD|nr:1,2-phenylacetyl-CoA epoxidase subunit PaaD [Gemmatimonadaceae bacterium]